MAEREYFPSWEATGIQNLRLDRPKFRTFCPRCHDSRRSKRGRKERELQVWTESGTFRCYHSECGFNGKVTNGPMYTRPSQPSGELNYSARQWLQHRGITDAVASRNHLFSTEREFEIGFPIIKNGAVCNIAYREFREKEFRQEPDAEPAPFGFDDAVGADRVVIVEGHMDKLAIESATGLREVISVPNGTNPNDDGLRLIGEAVKNAEIVLLAGDTDAVGRGLMELLAPRLGYSRCRLVEWGEYKDANEVLMEEGAHAVENALANARPFPVAGIVAVEDLYDLLGDLYDRGLPPGRSTGIPGLDRYFTVRDVGLTVFTGAPESGKTTFLDYMLVNMMKHRPTDRDPCRVGICSTEMVPLQRHLATLVSQWADKPFIQGIPDRISKDEMRMVARSLNTKAWFVLPEENTMDAIIDRSRVLKERHGINVLIIDPINDLDDQRPKWMSNTEYIHFNLRLVKKNNAEYGLHTIIVAHPRKLDKLSSGEYPVVRPWDIAESAGYYNRADNCLSLWRSVLDEDMPSQLHIQKVKFFEDGKRGKAEFIHDQSRGSFRMVDAGYYVPDRLTQRATQEELPF